MMSFQSCSNKRNTAFTRAYHSVNTRYNVHFNANEAYKEALKRKEEQQIADDNLSLLLHVYPEVLDSADLKHKGAFNTTIEKTTKAIKLHSIKTRPRRDPNKRGDKKYQEWVKQKEFNPFLVNTWMLLAKAEFEEGNYLRAITTFMYITKIYDKNKRVVSECKLWIARAYSEMGWRNEAENALRKMEQNEEIHHELLGMYTSIKANLYVRNQEYKSAIPFLEEAIRLEKSTAQKRRNKYLLGQLYTEIGEKQKAFKAFEDVRGLTTPYNYVVASKLRQIEVSDMSRQKMIADLTKMTRGSKNEDYLDQVYTALGNVYLNANDTIKAIENYSLAVEKSKRSTYDKALAQIKLGDLYFDRKEYIQAQPHYAGALPILKRSDEHYPLVSLRSEVLDQLVVHAKVVHEQDSLLNLADMPEAERIAFLEEYIAQLKKEDEKRAKEAELAERQDLYSQNQYTGWDDLNNQQQITNPMLSSQNNVSDFYFYNPSMVEQGKLNFQNKWGKRALEDNWRRRNKEIIDLFAEDDEVDNELQKQDVEIEKESGKEKALVTDKYSVDYYLQQLPLTDEAKAESYAMIENALFNMGLIYKNLLEDDQLAIETFETDLKRFPSTPNKEEIYFQLFLIYLKLDNEPLFALYRNMLISEFSKSKYAVPLSDDNYAWNFKYMAKLQEDLYEQTYQAYLNGDVKTVRHNYETIQQKYPFVSLMPKFAFLNSLSYAQTKDAPQLEKHLTKLIADYPQSDVIPLAKDILKNIKDGMILLSDGTPLVGMDWTMAYSNDSIFEGENAKLIAYQKDIDKPYTLLLMFQSTDVDRNELLYQVADYNFSNYVIQTYDLHFDENPLYPSLGITGFDNFKAIKSYLNKALLTDGLIEKLEETIIPIPISSDNYANIFPRLGMEEYLQFYADSLGTETPQLLAHWNKVDHREFLVQDIQPIIEEETEEDIDEEAIVPETGEEKITPSKLVAQHEDKGRVRGDKEIGLEDILSDDQIKGIGNIAKKKDDIIDDIQKVINNPVEGLKNIFNRKNLDENLTKEEKEELKKKQKEEKELRREAERLMKLKEDSISRVEKFRADSIRQVERAIQDSINTVNKLRKEAIERAKKDKEQKAKEEELRKQEIREKEKARVQQQKDRQERRKRQERERKELQKQKERERQELQKQRENDRRKREKEAEELRKQRERERKELEKRK